MLGCTITLKSHPGYHSCHTHTYQQAPYQDIEADDYVEWQLERGGIQVDWDVLSEYEKEDNTTGSRELACTAGVCEVVDLNAA